MKVLIATGGTGGHIYPALALAETIADEKADWDIAFWGSSNRMEAKLIPEHGYRFYGADMSGMTAGISAKIRSLLSLVKAEKYAKEVLKKEHPDIVVAFGNYISVPIVRAAHKMGIKVMLHEQNSFAGKANAYLAKIADAVAVSYESNFEQMPQIKDKMRYTGNPEATLTVNAAFDPAASAAYGINAAKPFVVFMMGSLGSESVSAVIDEACSMFDKSFQILIAAGKANDYTYQTKNDDRVHIVPFIDGKQMLKGCSLAVLRAGATTLAEITAVGTASILIPSPHVANNHQYFNAKTLVDVGAALMLEEKDLTKDSLSEMVNKLMCDPEKLGEMRVHARRMGKPDAAYEMIRWMEEITLND